MSDCRVTSETETQIVRIITIGKEGMMGQPLGTELRERIELAKPMQVRIQVFPVVESCFQIYMAARRMSQCCV